MQLRMFLLALGFPAHNPFERAAQIAMRKYHLMCLRDEAETLILAMVFVVVPFILVLPWIYVVLPAFFFLTSYAVFKGIAWMRYYWSDQPHGEHFYHVQFSGEVSEICKSINMLPVSVYRDLSQADFCAELIIRRGQYRILLSSSAEATFNFVERQGIYAHELGHIFLPLGLLPLAMSGRTFRAREFAADAIGACILGNAFPLIMFLHKVHLRLIMLGLREETRTHPPLVQRIHRLLDTDSLTHNKPA